MNWKNVIFYTVAGYLAITVAAIPFGLIRGRLHESGGDLSPVVQLVRTSVVAGSLLIVFAIQSYRRSSQAAAHVFSSALLFWGLPVLGNVVFRSIYPDQLIVGSLGVLTLAAIGWVLGRLFRSVLKPDVAAGSDAA